MLRSYDLLWSRLVSEYLLGESAPMSDLMAWNADATRMPARMHSQYLRRLFLNDDLGEGRYPVGGKPVSLGDIELPVFMVGTVTDHVAPWRSVHKLHHLTPAEITFVLTSGGHNAGIVSPPGHPKRHYQILQRSAGGAYVPPDDWLAAAPDVQGSWWPAWQQWLAALPGRTAWRALSRQVSSLQAVAETALSGQTAFASGWQQALASWQKECARALTRADDAMPIQTSLRAFLRSWGSLSEAPTARASRHYRNSPP